MNDNINKITEDFVSCVEQALGCTDGDDIRAHLYPEIKRVRAILSKHRAEQTPDNHPEPRHDRTPRQ